MQTISEMLHSTGRYAPGNLAVVYKDRKINYRELNELVNGAANGLLQLGLRQGDFIMLLIPNSVEFLIAHNAVVRIGAVSVPLNVMYKVHEIGYIGRETGAKAIIADAELWFSQSSVKEDLPELRHVVLIGDRAVQEGVPFETLIQNRNAYPVVHAGVDDIACVIYTSGTTGRPKGATQTHRSVLSNVQGSCTRNKLFKEDRLLLALPIYNNFALNVIVMSAFYCGATFLLIDRFDARKVLDAIREYRCTYFAGTPTMFSYLLNEFKEGQDDVSSLKFVNSGGAHMPVEVLKQVEEKFGCIVLDGFGHTEACGFSTLQPRVGVRKTGSVGTPISNVFVKIVDDDGKELPPGQVGEIIEYGDVFSVHGYLNAPEKNAEVYRDGWFYSGDLGYVDSDGYVYMTDRKQDLIITGGQNIYPVEVEEILYTHPKVALAAVIGIPDDIKGELAKAYIVLREGETAREQEIIDYVRERIAKFKAPRMVEFVDSLPTGPTGKILKKELRARLVKTSTLSD